MERLNKAVFKFSTDQISPELKGKGEKKYYVKGFITTDEIDLYGDLVTPQAMDDMIGQLKSGKIKLDIEHSQFRSEEPEIPIGRIVEAKKVEKDGKVMIAIKAELNKDHSKFKEVWKSITNKFLDAFSIAYNIVKSGAQTIQGKTVQLLEEIQLLNVAITGNPVNPGATMTDSFMKAKKRPSEKSMEKDGAHAHTEEEPLGLHNHPELENYIRSEVDWIYRRLSALEERVGPEEEKACKPIMSSTSNKESNLKSEGKMPEEETKPVEQEVPATESQAPAEKPAEEAETQPEESNEETKSLRKDVDSLKSLVEKQAEVIKNQTKSIEDLSKKLEQPKLKSLQEAPEASVEEGPVSIIRNL